MATRIPWNKYETALLMEAYLKVENKELSRKDSICQVSNTLRKRAKHRYIEIDEIFRNENGIGLRMSEMQYLMTDCKKGLKKPVMSKLFREMVELFRTNRPEFDKILTEAKTMVDIEKIIQNQYLAWLSTKVSQVQMAELYFTYPEIESFCLHVKILKKPLFETTDIKILSSVKQTVDSNKVFRFKYKRQISKMSTAIKYYYQWMRDNQSLVIKKEHVVKQDEAEPYTQEPETTIVTKEVESDPSICDGIYFVDFSRPLFYAFTKIEYLEYFGEYNDSIKNWKYLYVVIIKYLYNDYPEIIESLCGKNIGKGRRFDIVNTDFIKDMVAPREFASNLYVETNLSASNIIDKIRLLLDMCKIDYENVIIAYSNKGSQSDSYTMETFTSRKAITTDGTAFYAWMTKVQGMAPTTGRSYVSAIKNCESFAKDHYNGSCKLYETDDYRLVNETVNTLLHDEVFLAYNDRQHNRFCVAMKKYLDYLLDHTTTTTPIQNEPTVDLTPYKEMLAEKYQKGFRIGSGLEMKRFRNFWEKKYGSALEEDDEIVRKYICYITIQYNDLVYLPETMLDTYTQQKLLSYVANCFSERKKAIYYDALYKEFMIEFQCQRINNADMLKTYLSYINKGEYVINRSYIAADRNVEVDPTDEVRECLITYGAPIETDDLVEALSHIPRDKINWAIAGNNSAEFVRNQKGEYFHANIVDLTPTELDNITHLIQQAIDEKGFIGGNELVETISIRYPAIKERYPYLTQLGMRDAIGYKLRDVFSFKGKIISAFGQDLTMSDVFTNFAKSHEHFTLEQLNALKTELDTPIYFDSVYANSLRISKDDFVSKEHANFDVNATDAAIDRFCTGDYITISEIRHFGSFPYAGFPWNSFLLQQYVSDYSNKYKLMHSGFNASTPVGAIVKLASSKYEDFNELMTSALADRTILMDRDDALQYLCDNGFLARRSYGDIEQILVNANMQKSQKG